MISLGKMPRVSWYSYGFGVALVATVVIFLLASFYSTFPGDERALLELQRLQSVWLDNAAQAVSFIGYAPVAVGLLLASSLVMFLIGRRSDALLFFFCLVFLGIGNGLKYVIARSRPDYLLAGPEEHGYGFPSGHSLFAILAGGVVIFLIEQTVRPLLLRRVLQTFTSLVVLAIGLSRVYLGVHWPSDVLGAFLFGCLVLLGLIPLRKRLENGT